MIKVWAVPISLATTQGISVDLFSSGYLDVSVPPLTTPSLMCSARGIPIFIGIGSPIRASPVKSVRRLTEAFRSLTTPFFGL